MWILIAVVCNTADIKDCIPMIWPQSFITEEKCIEVMPGALLALPEGVTFAFPRCVATPGQEGA